MERQDSRISIEPRTDLLDELASGVRGVLGNDLIGLYLYGSSVSGGFDRDVSDIDLVAVTARDVESIDLVGLEQMHRGFVDRHPEWKDRIEIVYIGRVTLESFATSLGSLAVISPGEGFHISDDPVADWLQNWYLLRETGVAIYGPEAATFIPQIRWVEYVDALRRYAGWLRTQHRADATPGTIAYTILSLCRALRTVRDGAYCTKQDGAAWVRERMPDAARLIDVALQTRSSRGLTGFADEDSREAARALIDRLADEVIAT
jgi:hypothetical protein